MIPFIFCALTSDSEERKNEQLKNYFPVHIDKKCPNHRKQVIEDTSILGGDTRFHYHNSGQELLFACVSFI